MNGSRNREKLVNYKNRQVKASALAVVTQIRHEYLKGAAKGVSCQHFGKRKKYRTNIGKKLGRSMRGKICQNGKLEAACKTKDLHNVRWRVFWKQT